MPEFKSIREVAKSGLISEHYLRIMVKKGECPGVWSGRKFLINVSALCEKLDRLSKGAYTDE